MKLSFHLVRNSIKIPTAISLKLHATSLGDSIKESDKSSNTRS